MAADLIATAGPFFGNAFLGELKRMAAEMRQRGYPYMRAHQHGRMLVIEAWRQVPDDQGPLPSAELIEALIAGEIRP